MGEVVVTVVATTLKPRSPAKSISNKLPNPNLQQNNQTQKTHKPNNQTDLQQSKP